MPKRPDTFTLAAPSKPQRAPRPKTAQRGYGSKWQAASRAFLRSNPLCRSCARVGNAVAARVVDHIRPHKGDKRLFWDRDNWQPLCFLCHNRKSATE